MVKSFAPSLGSVRLWSLLAVLLFSGLAPRVGVCSTPTEMTTAREARGLTAAEARLARPVRLRGVVTVLSGWKSSFFFQDETSGISVDRMTDSPALQAGDFIELRGVTGPGLFAPIIEATRVTVLGKRTLPAARVASPNDLTGGREDGQRIAIHGIVRSAAARDSWGRAVLFLEIDIGGGNLVMARVHEFSPEQISHLPASTVTVTGVCGTVFNDRRQFVGLRLFVSSLNDVKIETPAPAEPFDIPLQSLGSLLQFGTAQGSINPIKIRGVVTYSNPGVGLYIQDGMQGIFVQSGQSAVAAVGSQLEAVGYPAVGHFSPKLDNAVFRIIGQAPLVKPVTQTASGMVVTNEGFSSAPFDSLLVTIEGRLIEEVPRMGEDLLLIQDGTAVFEARLSRAGQKGRTLATGSLLRVTGISVANTDDAHEARSFEILLRSPADIVVLRNAPWWTAAHAAWVVGALAALVLLMVAWVAVVRRQASLQTLAVSDPLTGLYNRRGFLLLAEQQWRLAQRGDRQFLLFYIDVDRFKKINDSFGHKEGDAALQTVANVLRESFRKADILGRLGGDEFAIAAIDAAQESQITMEKRLIHILEQHNSTAERKYHLALSVGALSCDKSLGDLSIEELITRADALMYQQKRNRQSQS